MAEKAWASRDETGMLENKKNAYLNGNAEIMLVSERHATKTKAAL